MIDKSDRILLAGPYVGEFGWTLFGWQGYIRMLSKNYKETHIICRPGEQILYADFASKFYEFDPGSWETNMHMCHNMKHDPMELVDSLEWDDYFSGNYFMDISYDGKTHRDNKGHFGQQIFHKYTGDEIPDTTPFFSYDLLFHPRNKPTGSDRNWSKDRWQELVDMLKPQYSIAVIGNEQAYELRGVDCDLRGVSLQKLVRHINASSMVVGPSSGPMHLASLCGKRHLVWSPEFNRIRYESWWNPFGTPVVFFSDGGWHPEPMMIKNKVNESFVRRGFQPDINEHVTS